MMIKLKKSDQPLLQNHKLSPALQIKGFSLIELLIVLTITGILSAIAYVGYHNQIIRTHRADGQTALLDLAIRMENYFSKANTYQSATISTGKSTDIINNATSTEGFYVLSLSKLTSSSYTLEATPTNSQTDDSYCQTLTFNSLGVKGNKEGPTGMPTYAPEACW